MTPEEKMAYNRAYYAKNKARILEQHKEYLSDPGVRANANSKKAQWKKRNPEKMRDQWLRYEKTDARKAYKLKNRARILARHRAYYQANRNHLRALGDQYSKAHRAEACAITAAWRKKNPDAYQQWCRENPDDARLISQRKFHKRRAAILGLLVKEDLAAIAEFMKFVRVSPVLNCHWCGKPTFSGKATRHIDHIVPLNHGGLHSRKNLCCACPTCNCRKRDLMPDAFRRKLTDVDRIAGQSTSVSIH